MYHLLIALLWVTLALASACSGPETKPDPQPDNSTMTTKSPPPKVDAPSAEDLAASPCGNPDWDKLPPGMKDKEGD